MDAHLGTQSRVVAEIVLGPLLRVIFVALHLRCLGQSEKAIDDLNEAIKIDPLEDLYYGWRARANALLGRDRVSQQDVERAVELRFDREILEDMIQRAMARP